MSRRVFLCALVVAATLIGCAHAVATVWTWRAPIQIDRGRALTGISCPSPDLCVATDAQGGILSSRDPSATSPAWTRTGIDPSGSAFAGVSCPSTVLCVAADASGDVFTSTDPASSDAGWIEHSIEPGENLTGIACPTTTLCVVKRLRLLEILRSSADELRPGATGAGIFANMARQIEDSFPRGEFPHHAGHAVGLSSFEDPHMIPADERPLENFMVIALEPGVYGPDQSGARERTCSSSRRAEGSNSERPSASPDEGRHSTCRRGGWTRDEPDRPTPRPDRGGDRGELGDRPGDCRALCPRGRNRGRQRTHRAGADGAGIGARRARRPVSGGSDR